MDVFVVDASPVRSERVAEMLATVPQARFVGEADSASGAIAAILAKKPDIVLLNLKLTDGSGFDVLRAVHAREPDIEIYVLVDADDESFRRHAERMGARGFFERGAGLALVRERIAARGVH